MVVKGKKARTISCTKAKPKAPVRFEPQKVRMKRSKRAEVHTEPVTKLSMCAQIRRVDFLHVDCHEVKTLTVPVKSPVPELVNEIDMTNEAKDITLDKLFHK